MYARDMPRLKAMQKSGTAFQDEDEDDPFGMGSSSSGTGKKRGRAADDESAKAAVFDEELKRSSARRRMLGMMDSGEDLTVRADGVGNVTAMCNVCCKVLT